MILEEYLEHGLAVDTTEGRVMEFFESWSQARLDEWLREHLPKSFEWLDARYGHPDLENGETHWVLLKRDHSRLFVVGRNKQVTGVEMSKAKGTAGKGYEQWHVRIGEHTFLMLVSHCKTLLPLMKLPNILYHGLCTNHGMPQLREQTEVNQSLRSQTRNFLMVHNRRKTTS